MTKLLTCPGPPEHQFENPNEGKRGRPPKFCEKHKPVKGEKPQPVNDDPDDVVIDIEDNPFFKKATAANNPFVKKAESVTGVTDVTDEIKERMAKVNPFVQKAQSAEPDTDKPRRKRGRPPKVAPAPPLDPAAIEREYSEIDDRIKRANDSYQLSFMKANKLKEPEGEQSFTDIEAEFNQVWNACDSRMQALLNLIARKRLLEKQMEELTNPETVTVSAPPIMCETGEIPASAIEEIIQRADDDAMMQEEYEAQGDEPENGYNDLLSNPEQYDDEIAEQFAHIMDEFDD